MLVNSSERDRYAMLMEAAYCAVLQNCHQTKIYRRIHDGEKFPLTNPKLVQFWTFSSPKKIKVSCTLTFKCRHHCMALHGHEQAVVLHTWVGTSIVRIRTRDGYDVHDGRTFRPDASRPGIGRPISFQSPSLDGKDTSKPCEIHIGERRWYAVGHSGRNSHEPKMNSKEFTNFL